MDAVELATRIGAREITPAEAVAAAVERARRVNGDLNAIIAERYEAALEAAATVDPSAGVGPLAGVPTLVKDCGTPGKGEPDYQGNRVLKALGNTADHDCNVVTRLREGGLVSLGRTHSPEFAAGNGPATCETEAFGATRNPWDPTRTAMGSSGGAAAAVAAGIVPLAHGNDGGGSIRVPAAACGLVGLKPTRGRISWGPDAGEFWFGAATMGMLSRSVRDTAAGLDVLTGWTPGDHYTAPPPERPFLKELGRDPGHLRVGLCTHHPRDRLDPSGAAAVAAVGDALADAGHDVSVAHPESYFDKDMLRAFVTMIDANITFTMNSYEARIGRPWTEDDVEHDTWQAYCRGRKVSAADYVAVTNTLNQCGRRISQWWEGDGAFDLLVTPTMGAPAPSLGYLIEEGVNRNHRLADILPYTQQSNITGQPAISLPLHSTDDGLPVGVQFVARFGAEALLLRLAARLEQSMPWADRRPPVYAD
ncbi:MAG: amidase [Acidimicrobiales bacterium]